MATTAAVNSTLVVISLGATPAAVGRQRSSSFKSSHAIRDITTKSSSGYAEHAEGLRSATFSISGVYYLSSGTANSAALQSAVSGRSTVEVTMGTGVSGDPKISATCYLENFSLDSEDQEGNVMFSADLKVTGAWTEGTFS